MRLDPFVRYQLESDGYERGYDDGYGAGRLVFEEERSLATWPYSGFDT